MSEIDRRGIEARRPRGAGRVGAASFVHISVDMDVVDPDVAPGVERRSAAASPTARPTSRWSSSRSRACSPLEVVESA